MKKAKKVLTLAACAVLLVCVTIGATVAYLTATTEEVKNTFTVGNVTLGDPDLKDGLTEADVNIYGEPLKDGKVVTDYKEADRVTANEYKLLPGHTYVKDPTVKIGAQSEEAYVRMIVTITDLADVKAVFGTDEATGYFLPQNFVEGWDSTKWITKGVEEKADGSEATYEFWYYKTVNTLFVDDETTEDVDESENTLTLEPLFTHIVVPETIENDDLAKVAGMQINVVAHAIQADGFNNATEAWAAWGN